VQDYLESAVKFLLRPRQRGSLYWITGSGQYRLKWLTFSPALTTNDTRHQNGAGVPQSHLARQKPERIASGPEVRSGRSGEEQPSIPNHAPIQSRDRHIRASAD
jgi:hypothetical protein